MYRYFDTLCNETTIKKNPFCVEFPPFFRISVSPPVFPCFRMFPVSPVFFRVFFCVSLIFLLFPISSSYFFPFLYSVV